MGHETVVADRDSEAAHEIEQPEQRPVKPRVVIEIAVERHTHDGAEHDGRKQENCPSFVVASYDRAGNICVRERWDIGLRHGIVS